MSGSLDSYDDSGTTQPAIDSMNMHCSHGSLSSHSAGTLHSPLATST